MPINVTKKSLSAQSHVNKIVKVALHMPYQAERAARDDIDFSNFWDVKRYRSSVEAIIWASVQAAAHLVESCLWLPNLIDQETKDNIWERLHRSAEGLIKDGLSKVQKNDNEEIFWQLHKRSCDTCNKPGVLFNIKHYKVCPRCLEEVVQIVFARASDTGEFNNGLSEVIMDLLINKIQRLKDSRQTFIIEEFMNIMASEPSSLPLDLKEQLYELSKIATSRLSKQ